MWPVIASVSGGGWTANAETHNAVLPSLSLRNSLNAAEWTRVFQTVSRYFNSRGWAMPMISLMTFWWPTLFQCTVRCTKIQCNFRQFQTWATRISQQTKTNGQLNHFWKKSEALWCPTEQNSHKFKQEAHKPVARFYCESGQKKRHKHCRERRCERLLWRNNNWSSSRNQLVLTEAIKNATVNRGAGW